MRLRPDLFLKEFLLFGATMVLGLLAAFRYEALTSGAPIIQVPSLSFADVIWLAILITLIAAAARFGRIARMVFWVFLTLIVISGSQIVLSIFLPLPWDVIAALAVAAVFFLWRIVLIHDAAMVLALAGMGAVIGISITPSVGIIALVVLSFYDIIAVYKTKHMVRMARSMIQTGAIFGFIIPKDFKSFLAPRRAAQEEHDEGRFMILGSGDIGLPLIFASSLMRESVPEAIIVGIFALAGAALTHLLFVNQEKRQAMAALPPIATMCLVGYLISLLIFT
ncbi:MAG: hypothetical protein A3C88_01920 [Candidatus Yanofskybacteria bacterium RIFCSPHIGHO2_02_FULL_50_12]|uniref:Uncharacterized protein n=1 Tax=Candidatus Yanofskybacteria bacterium RIFCSPHIGHO2_02_FULL_50_12 TaxID=1802685 RepID=A0A1F8FTR6_9BACT|nr:MAG: hypothetical protein A3C88_01920 [Candidatus Yanofskybacteria bacterium RIFCSPHIGHO2_02_FULL_50_12]